MISLLHNQSRLAPEGPVISVVAQRISDQGDDDRSSGIFGQRDTERRPGPARHDILRPLYRSVHRYAEAGALGVIRSVLNAGESLQYSLRVCGQIQGIFNMRLPVLRRVGIQPLLLNAEYRAASRESAERRLGLPFASVLEHQARMIWSLRVTITAPAQEQTRCESDTPYPRQVL